MVERVQKAFPRVTVRERTEAFTLRGGCQESDLEQPWLLMKEAESNLSLSGKLLGSRGERWREQEKNS